MFRTILALLLLTAPALADVLPQASFRADKCGFWLVRAEDRCIHPNQTGFTAGRYNLVFWPTLYRADEPDRFINSYWMPVKEGEKRRPVQFSGQLLILNAIAEPNTTPNYVARIWKNGSPGKTLGARIGVPAPQFKNAFIISLDMQDIADPGDTYQVQLYASHSEAQIDNHPLHTWWSGQ